MDVMAKLIRALQSDYKVGAEMQSGKPLIYIDPNKIDMWRLEKDQKSKDMDAVASQLAEQIDAQYPGISSRLTKKELVALTKSSLENGPFSINHTSSDSIICFINEPKNGQIKVDQIYETFGFNNKFDQSHLNALPGSNAEWAQMVGEHEGEHCNQDGPQSTDTETQVEVKTLDGEIRSDRAAFETLRKEGKTDIIAAWTAIRAISAANGDDVHATSIFLNDPEYTGVTEEHLKAAKTFKDEMSLAVAEGLGISLIDANKLRTEDPQKYARATEDALQKGNVPALRDMKENDMRLMVAETMGLKKEEAYKLSGMKSSDVIETYQKLKDAGSFKTRGDENPYVAKYAQSYVDATKVLFTKDTTPHATATPVETKKDKEVTPAAIVSKETEIDLQKEADLARHADYQADEVIYDTVKGALGLSDDQASDLLDNDPDKYYDTAERQLKDGKVRLQTNASIPAEQMEALTAQRLGVPVDDIYNQPNFLRTVVESELKREGLTTFKQDNRYLQGVIEQKIQQHHQEKINAEPPAPEEQPATPTLQDKNPFASSPETVSAGSKYNHLLSSNFDDGKGIPQVDLRSEDKAQMKIGALSASEYFATKADPVLAAQALELKNQPAPKVAQNDPKYLSAMSLQA